MTPPSRPQGSNSNSGRRRPRWVVETQATLRRAVIRVLTAVARLPLLRPVSDRAMKRVFDSLEPSWDKIRADPVYREALLDALQWGLEAHPPLGHADSDRWPETVLDVACGTGLASSYIAKRYPTASLRGVDISPRMVAHANSMVPGMSAAVGSGFELPVDSGSIDLVVSLDGVFDAQELARVCSPTGAILVVYSKGPACPVSRNIDVIAQELRDAGMDAITHRDSWWAVWSVVQVADR